MKWSVSRISLGSVASALFFGCAVLPGIRNGAFLPPEGQDPALRAGFSLEQANLARKLYQSKCAHCHQFRDPWEYDPVEWNLWTMKMSKKAGLNRNEGHLLSQYLITLRASEGTNRKSE
jgi:hypothetical protein